MNDYMRALHQRFFQEPDCTEIRRELETLRLTLRDKLDRQDRETLLAWGASHTIKDYRDLDRLLKLTEI